MVKVTKVVRSYGNADVLVLLNYIMRRESWGGASGKVFVGKVSINSGDMGQV